MRQSVQGLGVPGRDARSAVAQRRQDHAGGEGVEAAPSQIGIGVFVGDHFALFGDANAAAHRAFRLGKQGVEARAPAPPDRAAASVEQLQSQP